MTDDAGNKGWAFYSSFSLQDSANKYQLQVSGYSGNAGNELSKQSG